MRISASVGIAPKTVSLNDSVYKLTLTASTQGEKAFLAAMLKALKDLDSWDLRLRAKQPVVKLTVK